MKYIYNSSLNCIKEKQSGKFLALISQFKRSDGLSTETKKIK